MQSIKNTVINKVIIQKSKFICKLIPIQNILDCKTQLEKVKQEFPNATHYCYAYICGNLVRSSDDGEPSGTAGLPILNVLEKQGLNYVLAIVIRYFGGIKLGAGGLVRAYSNSVTEALNHSSIITLVPGKLISCTFPYASEKQMEHLLLDAEIVTKEYQEQITYQVKLSNEALEKLGSQIPSFHIDEEILIAK